MAKLRKIFSRFFKRPKKPQTPQRRSKQTLGGGHRGVAIGSLKKPDLSAENVQKWQVLEPGKVEAFVYDRERLSVHSTNVESARYFFGHNQMLVTFLQDGSYLYDAVTEDEAIQFAKAFSKGAWVWDYLRVRGSKTAHKKPYRKVGYDYEPPAPETEEEVVEGFVEGMTGTQGFMEGFIEGMTE